MTTVSAAATSTTPQISSFRLLPVEIARERDEPPRRKGRRVAPVLHGYKGSYSNMTRVAMWCRGKRVGGHYAFVVRVVTNFCNLNFNVDGSLDDVASPDAGTRPGRPRRAGPAPPPRAAAGYGTPHPAPAVRRDR